MIKSIHIRSPLISVITVCRNAADLIEPTILSILTQDYGSIEYLIIDGDSSDNTVKKAQEIAKLFPERKVRVVSEQDAGIADAMNKGVRLATGKIIAHLHAGDRYMDNAVITRVMNSYKAVGWRWAVAESVVVDKAGRCGHVYRANPDFRILLKKNCIPHQSTFLDKDVFDKHGMFRAELKQAMDYEFWLRIVFKGGERYQVLPFAATYFLEGGRSAQVIELIRYLSLLRKELRAYVPNLTRMDDSIFLGRVLAFATYARLRDALRKITFGIFTKSLVFFAALAFFLGYSTAGYSESTVRHSYNRRLSSIKMEKLARPNTEIRAILLL